MHSDCFELVMWLAQHSILRVTVIYFTIVSLKSLDDIDANVFQQLRLKHIKIDFLFERQIFVSFSFVSCFSKVPKSPDPFQKLFRFRLFSKQIIKKVYFSEIKKSSTKKYRWRFVSSQTEERERTTRPDWDNLLNDTLDTRFEPVTCRYAACSGDRQAHR